MKPTCPYCDNLVSAMDIDNYCSHKEQEVETVDSNAFYFAESQLSSGSHTSRFTLRTINNGYQQYNIGGRERILKNDNFLVLNEGDVFENNLDQDNKAEGLIVAFNPNFIKYYIYYINHNTEQLLDNPFEKTFGSLYFFNNSYNKTKELDRLLTQTMVDIKTGKKDPIYYQHIFLCILDELVQIENELHSRLGKIKALKKSTREELYIRLSNAKDYIDANLHEKLSLEKIARISCLSPFHFLRTFSDLYDTTPYQYILLERLKKANYYIHHTRKDIFNIMSESGFENKRTFQRAFQKSFGITAHELMLSVRA